MHKIKISHGEAVGLEEYLEKLYKCERTGVFGLVDDDNFERNPIQAAILVAAYFL